MADKYQIGDTDRGSRFDVTGPENRGIDGDGYWLGHFRSRGMAQLFVNALELMDLGAPIADGIAEFEDNETDDDDDEIDYSLVCESFSDDEIWSMYVDAKARHSWSDNSLAYDFGMTLLANSDTEEGDDPPYAEIGEGAISLLIESGRLTTGD